MKSININKASDLDAIPNLHPRLKEVIAATIAWGWDANIRFGISRNAISIRFLPELESDSCFDFMIKYQHDEEDT